MEFSNRRCRTDHPPYLLDLAPSDFYLFGYIKSRLSGISFDEGGGLLSVVETILGSIEKSALDRVFLEWMERLQRCIDTNGDYVE
jgi:hypothetical protein